MCSCAASARRRATWGEREGIERETVVFGEGKA